MFWGEETKYTVLSLLERTRKQQKSKIQHSHHIKYICPDWCFIKMTGANIKQMPWRALK